MIITDINLLKNISSDVSSSLEELEIVNQLEIELLKSSNGIGLAAPQIGIFKRVAIIRIGNLKVNLINSKILHRSGNIVFEEGCLSLPNVNVKVNRSLDVLVQNNGFLDCQKFAAFALPAVCIQHEMDHWDGILMTDKAISSHLETGPNMPCPCGSKLKYKKCCGGKKGA